jgi:hypothetical protein
MTDWIQRAEDAGRSLASDIWRNHGDKAVAYRIERAASVLASMAGAMKRDGASPCLIATCADHFGQAFADRLHDLASEADE